jgi:hypothetical protein
VINSLYILNNSTKISSIGFNNRETDFIIFKRCFYQNPDMLGKIVDEPFLAWNRESFGSESDFTYNLSPVERENLLAGRKNSILANYLREQYLEDQGFVLVRGLHKSIPRDGLRNGFENLCKELGALLPQNIGGDTIVEIYDRGTSMANGGRYHQSADGGDIHTDSPQWEIPPDYLGMICLNPALQGGESILVSAFSLHNELLKLDPELTALLYESFHTDKRGEVKDEECPTTFKPIFEFDSRREELSFRYLRTYLLQGHVRVQEPLGENQLSALRLLDQFLDDSSLQFRYTLKAGEILLVNNSRVAHGRTTFVDGEEPRYFLRGWIAKNAE